MKTSSLIVCAILAAQLASLASMANETDPCQEALEPSAPKQGLFSRLFAEKKAKREQRMLEQKNASPPESGSNAPVSAVPKSSTSSSNSSSYSSSYSSGSGGIFGYTPKPKTPEEIAREKKREAEHQAWLKEQKILKRAKADKLLEQIQVLLADSSNPEFVGALKDNLHAAWLVAASREFPTVGIAVSHAGAQLTPTAVEAYQAAVQEAVSKGKLVIYDADSAAAEVIARAAGNHGIGVTAGQSKPSSRVLTVNNPYLRFLVFRKAGKFIGSTDSLIAHGMDVDSNKVHWIGDDLPRTEKVGTSLPKTVTVTPGAYLQETSSFQSSYRDAPTNSRYNPSPSEPGLPMRLDDLFKDPFFSRMSPEKLEDIVGGASVLIEGLAEVDGAGASPLPRGAVILGAGQAISKYVDRVYDITYALARLGIPVTTGGAGGFMEVANAAAWDAGGESVGIPMGGKVSIAGEEKTAKSVQTRTIEAWGYETRIPLLLADRPIVGFAPGRKGTYQELGVLLTALNDFKSGHQIVFFISSSYYGNFVEALMQSPLPDSFKRRLRVVENPEQMASIVATMQESPGFQSSRLMGPAPVEPRSKTRSLPKPKVFTSVSSSFSGGIQSVVPSDGPPPFLPRKRYHSQQSGKGVMGRLFGLIFGNDDLW